MKHLFKIFNTFLLTSFILTGCDIKDNEVEVYASFLKVYDDESFAGSYIPLDIQQTADEGYIILSGTRLEESNFIGIHLFRLDEQGNFISDVKMETQYVHPTYNLIKTDQGYFFFCMDAVSLRANLVHLDEEGQIVEIRPAGNLSYPLYAAMGRDNNFILQSYNINDKQTILSVVSPEGNVGKSQGFGIGAGDDVEKPIIEHFTRTGKQLPFQAGQTSDGTFFFNGFFNYTFSLVFTDLNSGDPKGIAQGQQDDGGFSAVLSLENNGFAISRFNFGDNYISPKAEISSSGISSAVDLPGFSIPELESNAKVMIKRIAVNGENILLYASNTKNGQIALMAYEEITGELRGTKYLGFSYPYELAGFIQTADEGLAVAGLTQAAGRFPRVCLFKLSKEELREIVG